MKLISKIKMIIRNPEYKVLNYLDERTDKKICGTSLIEYVPSENRNDKTGVGYTGTDATRYAILDIMFKNVEINNNDRFLDIGCGKGRVLAYLLKNGVKASLTGVEINESVGKLVSDWTKKYDNVNIIVGNAFDLNYDEYDVFFMGRPFLPVTFKEFIEKFEGDVKHPIKLIYWVDQQSGHMLNDRPGWKCEHREKVFKKNGIKIVLYPQYYSIWTYTPQDK